MSQVVWQNGSRKKCKKIVATKRKKYDDEISLQVISTPKNNIQKKTVNTSDLIAKESEYQKKLKWLKDHGEWTREEGQNPEKNPPAMNSYPIERYLWNQYIAIKKI
jgi:hypothetical protein